MREETRCRHMGYSFRLTARVLLYAPSHRQDSTHHGLCYTSRGALAGTRYSSMGPPWRIDPTTHRTMSERSYHGATSRSCTDSVICLGSVTLYHVHHLLYQYWLVRSMGTLYDSNLKVSMSITIEAFSSNTDCRC